MADSNAWGIVIVAGIGLVGTVVAPIITPTVQGRNERRRAASDREAAEKARRHDALGALITEASDAMILAWALAKGGPSQRLTLQAQKLSSIQDRFELELLHGEDDISMAIAGTFSRVIWSKSKPDSHGGGALTGALVHALASWRRGSSTPAEVLDEVRKAADKFDDETGHPRREARAEDRPETPQEE